MNNINVKSASVTHVLRQVYFQTKQILGTLKLQVVPTYVYYA